MSITNLVRGTYARLSERIAVIPLQDTNKQKRNSIGAEDQEGGKTRKELCSPLKK